MTTTTREYKVTVTMWVNAEDEDSIEYAIMDVIGQESAHKLSLEVDAYEEWDSAR